MLLHTITLDLRYGARILLRNPGFTAVSVFALALGIGVNTVAFTAYKALVARPLDARDPSTMVNFALRLQSGAASAMFSYPDYEAYRDRLRSFSGVIAVSIEELRLTDAGGIVGRRRSEAGSLVGRPGRLGSNDMETVSAFIVSENFFSALGVTAMQGRAFESIPLTELARSPSALISENYWQRRFGGDPAVLGKTIRLNGAAFTIVGITPHNFVGTSIVAPSFWLPLSLYPSIHPASKRLEDRDDLFCRVFGRLAPDVSMRQAEAETSLLASQLRPLHGSQSDLSKEVTALISPGSPLPGINAGLRVTILLIMVAVGLVMAIACANVAGLQLARATTRQQELGVRMSLGASRLRLVQQLLTESALLGFLAGCVALPATWALLHVVVIKVAEILPAEFTLVLNVRPDLQVFGYVFAISFVAGILSGLAPAIESSGSALASTVRGVGISSVRGRRLRNGLIITQVSISLALMIAGGMLIRSAINTLNLKTGYDGAHVINLSLEFPDESKYSGDRKVTLVQELGARLSALPGVVGITSSRAPTDNGGRRAAVSLDGSQPSARNMHALLYYTWVQANYFQTLGVPMLLGHGFQSRSGASERLAILSESAARRLWPGQNPLGRSLRLSADGQFHNQGELLPDGPVWLVVGVARDTRGAAVDGSDSQQIYLPLPEDRIADYPVLVRTNSDPRSVIRAMGSVISAVDPDLAASVSTLQDMLSRTDAFLITVTSAAIASVISLFGLILVSMGIYSTISYIVVLRTREIGVRMAVGAQKRDILIQMIRESMRPVVVGLVVGMFFAAGASLLLRRVLYGVSAIDAVSFAGASLFFLVIALVASCPPAWRAMRVDPIVALRYE
jgi:putative ABC transport system permease protein